MRANLVVITSIAFVAIFGGLWSYSHPIPDRESFMIGNYEKSQIDRPITILTKNAEIGRMRPPGINNWSVVCEIEPAKSRKFETYILGAIFEYRTLTLIAYGKGQTDGGMPQQSALSSDDWSEVVDAISATWARPVAKPIGSSFSAEVPFVSYRRLYLAGAGVCLCVLAGYFLNECFRLITVQRQMLDARRHSKLSDRQD